MKLITAEEVSEWQRLEKAKGPNRTRLFRITSPFGYGAAIILTILTIMSFPNVFFYLGGFLVVGVLLLWCALGLGLTAIIPGQRRILKALKARRAAVSQT